MNATQCKVLLPVFQAWTEGKTIQFFASGRWINLPQNCELSFFDPPECYRIKPEPRTLFFVQDSSGELKGWWPTRQCAEEWISKRGTSMLSADFSIIEFKEVL